MYWIRNIKITLTSSENPKLKPIVIGGYGNTDTYKIQVSGKKAVSKTMDKGVVSIWNLEYDTIATILVLKYYNIKIEVGYGKELYEVFNGSVAYISQKIYDHHDCVTYINYTSELVAKFSQYKMNFSINSGVNLKSMLNYILKKAGNKKNANVTDLLARTVLQNTYTEYSTFPTIVDNVVNDTGYLYTTDSSLGEDILNIFSINNCKKLKISKNNVVIKSGNPTVTPDGLRVTLLPTYPFKTGNILVLDKDINLDISSSTMDSYNNFNANYLDENGEYLILELDYTFENRGEAFEYKALGRAMSIIKNIQS